MSRGLKRPRKSTQREPPAASGSGPSVGPRDIVKPGVAQAQQQDDGLLYSATPPSLPTKKLSRGNVKEKEEDGDDDDDDGSRQSEALSHDRASGSGLSTRPVKSALSSSARLALGPPGGSNSGVSDKYKRSMYIAFVDNAFAERERGSNKSYWDFVAQFRASAISLNASSNTQSLSLWLLALSHHVSKLDAASHSQLVENILDLPWAGASDEFAKSWCRFVCALVSARTEWAGSVLGRIVKAMRWRSDWQPLQPLNSPPSPSSLSSGPQPARPTRRLLYSRLHLLLRAILTLIPTLPSTLSALLSRHLPHKRESAREQATYMRNILLITRYEGQVAETVWRLVADRAIGLDVEIQIELDELEEGADTDEIEEDLANLDPFDRPLGEDDDSDSEENESDDESSDQDDSEPDFDDISDGGTSDEGEDGAKDDAEATERKARNVRDMVSKLDALLKVCFEHLQAVGTGQGRPRRGAAFSSLNGGDVDFESVLDSHPNWLQEFLGQAGSNSSTPTLERPQAAAMMGSLVKAEEGDVSAEASLPSAQPFNGRPTAPTSPSPEDEEAREVARHSLFQQLLNLFTRSILPTFKCRHVQFLLFWFCSLEPDFADFYLGLLIHKAIYSSPVGAGDDSFRLDGGSKGSGSSSKQRGDPIVLRQAAASYVASFVSRAKYISPQYTRTVVFNLCSFLEAHLEEHSTAVRDVQHYGEAGVDDGTARLAMAQPGSDEHAIFYAVAQAVFYIFCFRWQDLRNGDDAGRDEPPEDPLENDPGLIIGSLSSTGSSSFALPSSLHNHREQSASHLMAPNETPSFEPRRDVRYPSSPSLSATVVPPPTAAVSASTMTGGEWSSGLAVLQRVIVSPLNPLHFCSSTVVQQFASVAQHVGFLYCWSVIEANRRGGSGGAKSRQADLKSSAPSKFKGPTRAQNPPSRSLTKDLEGFFPFDPYRLRGTAERFVQPLYRDWSDVAPEGMAGGGDDESESEEEQESEAEDDDDEEEEEETGTENESNASSVRANSGGLQIPGRENRRERSQDDQDDAQFALSIEAMSVSAS